MNRAMILPAAIAAGLHAAVLCYKSSPLAPGGSAEKPEPVDTSWVPILPEEPPPPVDPFAADEPPDITPPQPITQGREVPVRESVAPFQIFRPPAPEVRITGLDRIPSSWSPAGTGPGDGPGWRVIDHLDNAPRALMRTAPVRPAGTGAIQEIVTVEFLVGKDGRVQHVRVTDSTNARLDDACLRAVLRWRFEPGLRKGVAVGFRMQQTFVFTTVD